MPKPISGEYAPIHETYISKVSDGDIIDILQNQQESTYNFLTKLPANKASYAYADGKWTIKQVVGHLTDTERIMAYRLVRFARFDETPLPGFDQDSYVEHAHYNDMELADLADEFRLIRKGNLYLYKTLTDDEKLRGGLASGYRVTVNALLYIIAGHENHHLQILKERYL